MVAVIAGVGALIAVLIYVTPGDGRPAGPCVDLVVNSSTEKADLVRDIADDYNAAERVFGDRCATVTVHKKTSGSTKAALAAGWSEERDGSPAPQVWLPTSSLWLQLLQEEGKEELVTGEPDSITKSVLVVAMPKKMAEVVKARSPDPGWADILKLATGDWASLDHPEWGSFALGRDNPHFSTSGLAATIAIYHAAAKQTGVDVKEIENSTVVSFVRGVESSVAHYGDDATKFMELVYGEDRKKPAVPFISAIVVQEQLAYLYNQGAPGGDPNQLGKGSAPNDPLVAIHPSDGTFELDHPYVVLSSASAEQRAAAADFREFLTEPGQQARFIELGFRTNDGRATEKLASTLDFPADERPELITPPASGLVKRMLDGWNTHRRLARVLLVLDVSGSMKELADKDAVDGPLVEKSKMDLLRPAATRALDLLSDRDQVGLWTFSSNPPYTEQVPMSPVGEVRRQLAHIIATVPPAGNTALYTTTRDAHQMMANTIRADMINAVVLLSDGENTPTDEAGKNELLAAVDASQLDSSVRIFTIPYGKDADVETLSQIAQASKALTYDATNPVDIDKVFVSVFSNF